MNLIYRISVSGFYILLKLLHNFKVHGKENLPEKGPFICAANHVSFADPPVVGASSWTFEFHYMAKQELFDSKKWGWWFKAVGCIPIARNDRDIKATKEAIRRLQKGECVGIFPEGTRSVTGELQEGELGVAFLAAKSGAPVVPMYISGTNMALPKGGPYKPGVPVSLYIGPTVDFQGVAEIAGRKEKYAYMSGKIMSAIAELKAYGESNEKKQCRNSG